MYINFQQNQVSRSLKTVHTNIFANNRKLHKIATTNGNIAKNNYFRNASSYNVRAGAMLNFFSGWPIGPAKINFGWPAVNFTCPRYYYRFW